jgi:geranylgeranyl diphosphate synthase type II
MMGKAVGTDKLRNKSTYPSLLGLEESKKFAKDLVENALQALESFDKKAEPLRAIANYVINRKK